MATTRDQSQGARAYGREALAEWSNAIRYGRRAIVAGATGAALARLGAPGRLASKAGVRRRLVNRIAGEADETVASASSGEAGGEKLDGLAVPFPIQESIDVAVPLGGAFELCSQFLDFADYLERVVEVEEADDSTFVFVAKVGGRLREIEVEIVDERPEERIEWECDGELRHTGVLTLHPLAPRLTRLELTIEREPEGFSERLARQVHLPERAIQAELHRFKAHAELLDEDFDEYVRDGSTEEAAPDEEAPEDEEPLDEEQVDEEELEPA